MLFARDDLYICLLGVYLLERSPVEYTTEKRNFHVLSHRLQGCAEMEYRGRRIPVGRSDVLYIPSNIKYSQRTQGERLVAVHLLIPNQEEKEIETFTPDDAPLIDDWFLRLYEKWEERGPGYRYECTAMVYQILARLACQCRELADGSQNMALAQIRPSVDFLRTFYADSSITIGQAAACSNVSEVYFRKLFAKAFHCSPSRYLTELRISKAAELLRSGYYTVGEAAERSGFNDPKYFRAVFKRQTGWLPRQYRNRR